MHIEINPTTRIESHELKFQFTRSRGPGGQNVNKVSTRVEVLFDVAGSRSLTDEDKSRILRALKTRIDSSGVLHLTVDESRSQWKNRELAVAKLTNVLRSALVVHKNRIATKPKSAAKEIRVREKKSRGVKKKLRGRVDPSAE